MKQQDDQLDAVLMHYQDLALFDGCTVEDANSLAIDGDSVLHKAVMMKDVAGIRILLENSADPNYVGDMGETPLHQAAFHNNVEIAEILINFGATVNIENEFGETPIDLAKTHKLQTLFDYLRQQ